MKTKNTKAKQSKYCIDCKQCKFKIWVPHHPLFQCLKGGKMNERTTETKECPLT
jgi:hypothetical protein